MLNLNFGFVKILNYFGMGMRIFCMKLNRIFLLLYTKIYMKKSKNVTKRMVIVAETKHGSQYVKHKILPFDYIKYPSYACFFF